MQHGYFLKNAFVVSYSLVRYNLKIIFANKFIYFLLAALFIFFFVVVVNLMNVDAQLTEASVFWLLLVPGILLLFYPTTFGIQNDVDNRMIEILFGIPNYRYKVWLFRLLLIFVVVITILFFLSLFSSFALTAVPVIDMIYHLIFPIMFLGSMAFMVSTIVRNGSGTAVVMVVISITFWIAREIFQRYPKWDVFLNPFNLPQNINEAVWAEIVIQNRIYLLVLSIFAVLYGILNLQKREKFL